MRLQFPNKQQKQDQMVCLLQPLLGLSAKRHKQCRLLHDKLPNDKLYIRIFCTALLKGPRGSKWEGGRRLCLLSKGENQGQVEEAGRDSVCGFLFSLSFIEIQRTA